ncbi:ImmA/IrrE family metallo-endopeptidase [Agrococcus sp. ARC_14]|uniref:ImmA/IrrE family metallo-endopeptidase n=1 Tax=Agrococcus sp. ARC_14 TaxID=2919927 RepID=UPI001F06C7CB|nr:ImmA/IrrE family metallo-endopeptidase [Agrococcus sp. ARC_14]MCH1884189.1 ImmA/IrrE family metallo-endopeptidase [Agrococcus sp. ARC_14]
MDLRHGAASLEGTSPTLSELVALCSQLRVDVRSAPLPSGWLGAYDHTAARILLLPGLTPVEQRSVLAHELGHALRMDTGDSAAAERAAERFAALLLIDPAALKAAVAWARDETELAEELGVTVDIVRSYLALRPRPALLRAA